MAEEGFRRKLTAILSADVEGYSRLIGDGEDATIHTLTHSGKASPIRSLWAAYLTKFINGYFYNID